MFKYLKYSAPLSRHYSTTPGKPPIQLIAELRKLTEVSITKAREALSASNNDVNTALEWLQKDLVASGARKAAKLGGRKTKEGLISVSLLSRGAGWHTAIGGSGVRAAMVELNCETDFVGRNALFGRLAADIAHTAAYISEPTGSRTFQNCSIDLLQNAPLLSHSDPTAPPVDTVGDSIRNMISKVGEIITLRRATAIIEEAPRLQSQVGLRLAYYIHGSFNQATQGRIGTLALLALASKDLAVPLSSGEFRENLEQLERAIARQIVGFETNAIDSSSNDQTVLYNQPFMMYSDEQSGQPVRDVLRTWSKTHLPTTGPDDVLNRGIAVLDFAKWTIGEDLDNI